MIRTTLLALCFLILTGCASTKFKAAQDHANAIRNGMTSKEVIAIIGIQPTRTTPDEIIWIRPPAIAYNATTRGAIRFKLKDDHTVDIPDGGIFGSKALDAYRWEQAEKAELKRQQDQELERQRAAAVAKQLQEDAAAKEQERIEFARLIQAERAARDKSAVRCQDKQICTKMFSLAQIYTSSTADQKIQVATDTIIETYNPTENSNIGIKIVKTPMKGSAEEITISVTCKAEDSLATEKYCISKRTRIYAQFRPFIENALAK